MVCMLVLMKWIPLALFLDEVDRHLLDVLVHLLAAVLHISALLDSWLLHSHRWLRLLVEANVFLHYAGMHFLELPFICYFFSFLCRYF